MMMTTTAPSPAGSGSLSGIAAQVSFPRCQPPARRGPPDFADRPPLIDDASKNFG